MRSPDISRTFESFVLSTIITRSQATRSDTCVISSKMSTKRDSGNTCPGRSFVVLKEAHYVCRSRIGYESHEKYRTISLFFSSVLFLSPTFPQKSNISHSQFIVTGFTPTKSSRNCNFILSVRKFCMCALWNCKSLIRMQLNLEVEQKSQPFPPIGF